MKALALLSLAALLACSTPDAPLAPTAPSRSSSALPIPNLPADVTFVAEPASDGGMVITARWTDTNNGTALVDFGIPSPYYSPYWIVKSSWYGTQTTESWWVPAGVYEVHVRTRSPYQEAFVMPTPENIVTEVAYSDWSGAYTVDATGGTLTVAGKRKGKK